MANSILGNWGEIQAAAYLKSKRYKILDSNFRCRYGEIDLIVENKQILVFVEVKTRKNSNFAHGREAVDHWKQERIITTASYYLSKKDISKPTRFDVIEVYAPDGINTKEPTIIHLEDAFQ